MSVISNGLQKVTSVPRFPHLNTGNENTQERRKIPEEHNAGPGS